MAKTTRAFEEVLGKLSKRGEPLSIPGAYEPPHVVRLGGGRLAAVGYGWAVVYKGPLPDMQELGEAVACEAREMAGGSRSVEIVLYDLISRLSMVAITESTVRDFIEEARR